MKLSLKIFITIFYPNNDPYFVLKDFEPYLETHELVEQAYRDKLPGSI